MKIAALILPLLTTIALMFPIIGWATPSVVYENSASRVQSPSFVRVGILGGMGLIPPSDPGENGLIGKQPFAGLLTVGLGKGTWSLDTGVGVMTMTGVFARTDADHSVHQITMGTDYLVVPVCVKWNYIERPLATFYVKAGAAPISAMDKTQQGGITPAASSTLGIIGLGGSSELGQSTAFVLDLMGAQNLGSDNAGIPKFNAILTVGLSYAI